MNTENELQLFEDYNIDKAYNGILAIEPELGIDLFMEHTKEFEGFKGEDICRLRTGGGSINKDYFKKEYNDLLGHTESNMIFEIDNMHLLKKKRRLELIKDFTEKYKGYFTYGGSKRPSGGVHFHVFGNKNLDALSIFKSITKSSINKNLLYTNLFNVINDNKAYNRAVYCGGQFDIGNNGTLSHSSRSRAACTKNDFLPGIEFRANNVFDIRLYGYYVALTIISKLGITLANPYKRGIPSILTSGIQEQLDKTKSIDKYGRVHCSLYQESVNFKDSSVYSFTIMKQNIGKMLFVLSINGLTEARKALEEYIKDTLNIKIKAIPFDTLTGKSYSGSKGYIFSFDGVKCFSKTNKGIRRFIINNKKGTTTLIDTVGLMLNSISIKEVKLKREL